MDLPSGETIGNWEERLVTCTGGPPSMPTFQIVGLPERSDVKITKRPSEEQTGDSSTYLPSVSCFKLVPSTSIRQRLRAPDRFDWKMIYRPSTETVGC